MRRDIDLYDFDVVSTYKSIDPILIMSIRLSN